MKVENITGMRIREMRLEKNWTQKELAQKLELKNDTAIANYEAGYSIPKDEIKLKICELFNCSVDYLMGNSKYKTKQEELNHFLENQNKIIILETLQIEHDILVECQINEDDVEFLLEFLSNSSEILSKEVLKKKLDMFLSKFNKNEQTKVRKLLKTILDNLIKKNEEKNYFYYLKLSVDKEFQEQKDIVNTMSNIYMCPVYENILAKTPYFINDNIKEHIIIDTKLYNIDQNKEYFSYEINENYINFRNTYGHYIIFQKQNIANNDDIVLIVSENFSPSVKKYRKVNDNLIMLQPIDMQEILEPLIVDSNHITVLGKAIGYIGKFEMKM